MKSNGQILLFQCDKYNFAIPVEYIYRITLIPALTQLPQAPPMIAGLVNLSGEFVPVMNMRERFGFPLKKMKLEDYLIFVRLPDRNIALWVDSIGEIESLPKYPESEAENRAKTQLPFIHGLVELEDKILFIYDLDLCLSQDESAILDAAMEKLQE
ncbi:purine-binding chemotaxis protein CheW [bacterium]|nr:purine-binding chemotaxis protein CheW [bacterium]